MKIIVKQGTPTADPELAQPWEMAVKTANDFVWIHHNPSQQTSRWKDADRMRPFLVEHVMRNKRVSWMRIGAYKTLDSAIKGAQRWVSLCQTHYGATP